MLFDGGLKFSDTGGIRWILLKQVLQEKLVGLLIFYKTVDLALL
jgi:hypothetical protein